VIVVALDTATRSTVAALLRTDAPPLESEARDDPPRGVRPRHATRLLGLVTDVLERADVGWDAVDRIAVGVGPGTFTGLRIGIASARALARAREIELVGVSTLRSIATHAASQADWDSTELVLAVLDARRGEVFAAAWGRRQLGPAGAATTGRDLPRAGAATLPPAGAATLPPAGAATLPPRACSAQTLASVVGELGLPTLAIGEGAVEFREVLERAGALIPADESELHRVSAITHCQLALSMRGSSPDQVHPEYLRLPDAEINRRSADRR
jgi:tRNA threonylcarbamoyladenosine biosynthesis protein TsaB